MEGFNSLALLRSDTNSHTWWGFSDTEVLKLVEYHFVRNRRYKTTAPRRILTLFFRLFLIMDCWHTLSGEIQCEESKNWIPNEVPYKITFEPSASYILILFINYTPTRQIVVSSFPHPFRWDVMHTSQICGWIVLTNTNCLFKNIKKQISELF